MVPSSSSVPGEKSPKYSCFSSICSEISKSPSCVTRYFSHCYFYAVSLPWSLLCCFLKGKDSVSSHPPRETADFLKFQVLIAADCKNSKQCVNRDSSSSCMLPSVRVCFFPLCYGVPTSWTVLQVCLTPFCISVLPTLIGMTSFLTFSCGGSVLPIFGLLSELFTLMWVI